MIRTSDTTALIAGRFHVDLRDRAAVAAAVAAALADRGAR